MQNTGTARSMQHTGSARTPIPHNGACMRCHASMHVAAYRCRSPLQCLPLVPARHLNQEVPGSSPTIHKCWLSLIRAQHIATAHHPQYHRATCQQTLPHCITAAATATLLQLVGYYNNADSAAADAHNTPENAAVCIKKDSRDAIPGACSHCNNKSSKAYQPHGSNDKLLLSAAAPLLCNAQQQSHDHSCCTVPAQMQ